MDRRLFLKLFGLSAVLAACDLRPVAAQLTEDETPIPIRPPGLYQITGRVRLHAPMVEISGISNAQQISWADLGRSAQPVAGFSSFEHFDAPWRMPPIRVRGGQLEALSVVPIDLA
jgi:hypothetical protein